MAIELVLAIAGTFLTIAIVTAWIASTWLSSREPVRRRLQSLLREPIEPLVEQRARSLVEEPSALLARVSKLIPKSASQMSALELRLAQAGLPGRSAAMWFALAEAVLPTAAFAVAIVGLGLANWAIATLVGCAAALLPRLYVVRQTRRRRKAIRDGLPDALDLLTLCVEAGAGLDQAIAIAGDELTVSHPALAAELRMMTTEIRVGRARLDAFANLAERTSVDDVRTLAAMLAQTERFGTSIGHALRTHAATARTTRRQHAEERAAKIGVKMVFPLVLCLFPALYVVAFGPVVIRIINELFSQ